MSTAAAGLVAIAAVPLLVLGFRGLTPADVPATPAPTPQAVAALPPSQTDATPPPRVQPVVEALAPPEGEPMAVEIPAIGVRADLVVLGLEPDGAMEVPDFGLAGWYAEGPKPGHPGPALIAAHVDSRSGPDVFFRLRELTPGDEITVRYDSGDETTFVVESSERTPKDELPGDRIWPVTADRLLTLITCGGEFDRDTRHYRDNIIVYSSPLDG